MKNLLASLKIDILVWVILLQLCVAYGFLRPLQIDVALNDFGVALLVFATFCTTVAGQIIIWLYSNRYQKQITDKKENILFNFFLLATITGVGIGFYLSNVIARPIFVTIFIIISALCYLHATYLKELFLIKNVVIAFFVAMVVLVPGIFDLLPAITMQNQTSQQTIFSILSDYAVLLFILTLIYELISDCQHAESDLKSGITTVATKFGITKATRLCGILLFIPMGLIFYYLYTYFFSKTKVVAVTLLLWIAPLLIAAITLFNKTHSKAISRSILLLKLVFLLIALSFVTYPYIII
ncbi:UbiA family prenyltransferase [Aquimarina sp. ERC-38]|uniref:UbiA family prenyltransferase n=1 Tax=Aquimarina sp. ERC-38 TaxID=2949996 RepID=UPI00224562AE|nr:UbiA family prenyltransferase [Aquimarina sp. ERC-38]UZO80064.1 UbiA family prenyltransferase [Aquimarina sp. ERC-38]